MDVGILAGARFPITEPFLGGLEMHTHVLGSGLVRRGHDVTVYAAGGDGPYAVSPLLPVDFTGTASARMDVSSAPATVVSEHHSYLDAVLRLSKVGHDVVHVNSCHYLPFATAGLIPSAMTATLHSPPTVWLESALALAADSKQGPTLISVSAANAALWSGVAHIEVIHNGIDLRSWTAGSGGDRAVWFGRIAPEKAPHLALGAAALAGIEIDIVGPIQDERYFEQHVVPLLGPRATYLGHLATNELAGVVGSARVAVVTPAWEEPFGLVIAEALACGTPVAAFDRGAVSELLDHRSGRIAPFGDLDLLAAAIDSAGQLDRRGCRQVAEERFNADVMVERYERRFEEVVAARRSRSALVAADV